MVYLANSSGSKRTYREEFGVSSSSFRWILLALLIAAIYWVSRALSKSGLLKRRT